MERADVVVVGLGAMGSACAYQLAIHRSGARVSGRLTECDVRSPSGSSC
jgi:glycine/D-amino acid oxidase-like deaminating enzyme